jgi:hypothetical protein
MGPLFSEMPFFGWIADSCPRKIQLLTLFGLSLAVNTFYTKEDFLYMVDVGSYVMYPLRNGVTLVLTDVLSKCVIKCYRQERWTCLALSGAFTVYLKWQRSFPINFVKRVAKSFQAWSCISHKVQSRVDDNESLDPSGLKDKEAPLLSKQSWYRPFL